MLGQAVAQSCLPVLEAAIPEEHETATTADAVMVLARAVQLLEPALPRLRNAGVTGFSQEHAAYDAAEFLAQRYALPADLVPDTLTIDVWQQMLDMVASWYALSYRSAGDLSTDGLIKDANALIETIKPHVKPVALVASAPANKDEVAFWAVFKRDSIYPRMIVYRPPAQDINLQAGVNSVLPELGNCANTISDYVYAPLDTAQKLFLANNKSRMIIAQLEPHNSSNAYYVPEGEEPSYFTFSDPSLTDVTEYAALFEGPMINPVLLARIIPQLRTNMNPKEIYAFIQGQ